MLALLYPKLRFIIFIIASSVIVITCFVSNLTVQVGLMCLREAPRKKMLLIYGISRSIRFGEIFSPKCYGTFGEKVGGGQDPISIRFGEFF